MYYCYGITRSQLGQIPASSDTAATFTVFTAGECPVEIIGGSYFGGDGGEAYSLYLAPPDYIGNGTLGVGTDGQNNGLICITSALVGGAYNGARRGNVYRQDSRFDASIPKYGASVPTPNFWIVPPYYNVIAASNTATNTTALSVLLIGMDLIKPGESKYA